MDLELIDPSILSEEEIIMEAERLLTEAGKDINKKSKALDTIAERLVRLDAGTAELFIDDMSSKFGIKKKIFQEKYKTALSNMPQEPLDVANVKLPDGVDPTETQIQGWFKHKNCYFFVTKDGLFKASNFVVKPLYHIYSKRDNKRLVKIVNEFGLTKILDIPSKVMTSPDQFQSVVFGEGHYIFFGSKFHYYRLLDDFSKNFEIANELRTLGWQREGFYAFANGIFNGKFQPIDELGVSTHNEHKYFSPAFSTIYADVREDDDEYENDRFFIYKETKTTFKQWADLTCKVYGDNGRVAIAFAIACLFRDLVYERYKIFPILFLFGDKGSGKSQLAWSLSNLFFDNMPGFNLNSGTQVGFYRRMGRVKNAITWYDEYTNDIDERRFQSLKASYDGLGHEKGEKSTDNRSTTTKINSGIVVSGQYLPNRDSNALFSRSVMLSFEAKKYNKEETERYDLLKKMEEDGLSGMLSEILLHRAEVEKKFSRVFSEEFEELKDRLQNKTNNFDERLVRNFTCILTAVKILENLLEFPFTYKELLEQSLQLIIATNGQISSSESVSTFWHSIEYMLDKGDITNGIDFKIENHVTLKLIKKHGKEEEMIYHKPTPLVFFRFSKIHPMYLESHRRQTGKSGVDMVSLQHYIKNHRYYQGYIKSTRFDNTNTSAFVLQYKDGDDYTLGINLDRMANYSAEGEEDDTFPTKGGGIPTKGGQFQQKQGTSPTLQQGQQSTFYNDRDLPF